MKIKKIYLSGDHAGFKLKENVKKWLLEKYEVEDIGPLVYDKKDDYPDFVIPMARKVAKNKNSRGLIIAGSGQGEAIATNKIKGIKAGLYHGYYKKWHMGAPDGGLDHHRKYENGKITFSKYWVSNGQQQELGGFNSDGSRKR